jgi:hypothetical protein
VSFDHHRRWVDGLRAIPLPEVLRAVGAEADGHDPVKWHTAQGVLSVNGAKFFDWNQGRGGGGAIDLAMHLNACDFTAAVRWLLSACGHAQAGAQHVSGTRIPCSAPPQRAPSSQPMLSLPTPAAGQLDRVQRYLREQRRLPEALLKPLRNAGRLYADRRANAVFVLLGKDGHPVGAELRGTCLRADLPAPSGARQAGTHRQASAAAWRGLAPGSRKDLGSFACGPAQAHELVLCESAIDAISCTALYPDRLCLSTAGARPNPAWLPPLLAHHRLYCGFDADPTGDQMAAAMIAIYPAIRRLRPPLHDWNDVLTA